MTSVAKGAVASAVLLLVYVTIVSLVSGWSFMLDQFSRYWYFVVPLAVGFGILVGLYSQLKAAMKEKQAISGRIVVVSGTTSTAAMVSCCAHYLVNFLPILGVVGIVTVIGQYQIQLFWLGLIFNLAGLCYMLYQLRKFNKTQ